MELEGDLIDDDSERDYNMCMNPGPLPEQLQIVRRGYSMQHPGCAVKHNHYMLLVNTDSYAAEFMHTLRGLPPSWKMRCLTLEQRGQIFNSDDTGFQSGERIQDPGFTIMTTDPATYDSDREYMYAMWVGLARRVWLAHRACPSLLRDDVSKWTSQCEQATRPTLPPHKTRPIAELNKEPDSSTIASSRHGSGGQGPHRCARCGIVPFHRVVIRHSTGVPHKTPEMRERLELYEREQAKKSNVKFSGNVPVNRQSQYNPNDGEHFCVFCFECIEQHVSKTRVDPNTQERTFVNQVQRTQRDLIYQNSQHSTFGEDWVCLCGCAFNIECLHRAKRDKHQPHEQRTVFEDRATDQHSDQCRWIQRCVRCAHWTPVIHAMTLGTNFDPPTCTTDRCVYTRQVKLRGSDYQITAQSKPISKYNQDHVVCVDCALNRVTDLTRTTEELLCACKSTISDTVSLQLCDSLRECAKKKLCRLREERELRPVLSPDPQHMGEHARVAPLQCPCCMATIANTRDMWLLRDCRHYSCRECQELIGGNQTQCRLCVFAANLERENSDNTDSAVLRQRAESGSGSRVCKLSVKLKGLPLDAIGPFYDRLVDESKQSSEIFRLRRVQPKPTRRVQGVSRTSSSSQLVQRSRRIPGCNLKHVQCDSHEQMGSPSVQFQFSLPMKGTTSIEPVLYRPTWGEYFCTRVKRRMPVKDQPSKAATEPPFHSAGTSLLMGKAVCDLTERAIAKLPPETPLHACLGTQVSGVGSDGNINFLTNACYQTARFGRTSISVCIEAYFGQSNLDDKSGDHLTSGGTHHNVNVKGDKYDRVRKPYDVNLPSSFQKGRGSVVKIAKSTAISAEGLEFQKLRLNVTGSGTHRGAVKAFCRCSVALFAGSTEPQFWDTSQVAQWAQRSILKECGHEPEAQRVAGEVLRCKITTIWQRINGKFSRAALVCGVCKPQQNYKAKPKACPGCTIIERLAPAWNQLDKYIEAQRRHHLAHMETLSDHDFERAESYMEACRVQNEIYRCLGRDIGSRATVCSTTKPTVIPPERTPLTPSQGAEWARAKECLDIVAAESVNLVGAVVQTNGKVPSIIQRQKTMQLLDRFPDPTLWTNGQLKRWLQQMCDQCVDTSEDTLRFLQTIEEKHCKLYEEGSERLYVLKDCATNAPVPNIPPALAGAINRLRYISNTNLREVLESLPQINERLGCSYKGSNYRNLMTLSYSNYDSIDHYVSPGCNPAKMDRYRTRLAQTHGVCKCDMCSHLIAAKPPTRRGGGAHAERLREMASEWDFYCRCCPKLPRAFARDLPRECRSCAASDPSCAAATFMRRIKTSCEQSNRLIETKLSDPKAARAHIEKSFIRTRHFFVVHRVLSIGFGTELKIKRTTTPEELATFMQNYEFTRYDETIEQTKRAYSLYSKDPNTLTDAELNELLETYSFQQCSKDYQYYIRVPPDGTSGEMSEIKEMQRKYNKMTIRPFALYMATNGTKATDDFERTGDSNEYDDEDSDLEELEQQLTNALQSDRSIPSPSETKRRALTTHVDKKEKKNCSKLVQALRDFCTAATQSADGEVKLATDEQLQAKAEMMFIMWQTDSDGLRDFLKRNSQHLMQETLLCGETPPNAGQEGAVYHSGKLTTDAIEAMGDFEAIANDLFKSDTLVGKSPVRGTPGARVTCYETEGTTAPIKAEDFAKRCLHRINALLKDVVYPFIRLWSLDASAMHCDEALQLCRQRESLMVNKFQDKYVCDIPTDYPYRLGCTLVSHLQFVSGSGRNHYTKILTTKTVSPRTVVVNTLREKLCRTSRNQLFEAELFNRHFARQPEHVRCVNDHVPDKVEQLIDKAAVARRALALLLWCRGHAYRDRVASESGWVELGRRRLTRPMLCHWVRWWSSRSIISHIDKSASMLKRFGHQEHANPFVDYSKIGTGAEGIRGVLSDFFKRNLGCLRHVGFMSTSSCFELARQFMYTLGRGQLYEQIVANNVICKALQMRYHRDTVWRAPAQRCATQLVRRVVWSEQPSPEATNVILSTLLWILGVPECALEDMALTMPNPDFTLQAQTHNYLSSRIEPVSSLAVVINEVMVLCKDNLRDDLSDMVRVTVASIKRGCLQNILALQDPDDFCKQLLQTQRFVEDTFFTNGIVAHHARAHYLNHFALILAHRALQLNGRQLSAHKNKRIAKISQWTEENLWLESTAIDQEQKAMRPPFGSLSECACNEDLRYIYFTDSVNVRARNSVQRGCWWRTDYLDIIVDKVYNYADIYKTTIFAGEVAHLRKYLRLDCTGGVICQRQGQTRQSKLVHIKKAGVLHLLLQSIQGDQRPIGFLPLDACSLSIENVTPIQKRHHQDSTGEGAAEINVDGRPNKRLRARPSGDFTANASCGATPNMSDLL